MTPRPFARLALGALSAFAALSCAGSGGVHARFAFGESSGLRVVDVPDGPAASAGLRAGDRITHIDGEPVRSLAYGEVVERLRGRIGSEVTLQVSREGELHELVVRRAPYAPAATVSRRANTRR